MPGIAECGPCDDIAPAITFGRRERRSGCGPRCSGYDCGHSHVDASAPGLFRGVAAPLLRWLLASSLVAAAAAAAATEPDGDGGGVGPVVLLACAVPGLLLIVILLRTWWIVPQVHADTSGLADAATLARCLAKQDEYAERLGAALRCKTISHDDDGPDHDPAALGAETRKLHALLRAQFPLVHARLKLTVVNQLSLVYEWVGEEETLPPYAVYAHLDVVPTPDAHLWRDSQGELVAPFSGRVHEGCVWGRGAIDNKQAVLGHLEAIEDLLQQGVTPRRTCFLLFGHDEELGGEEGAKHIARLLAERGVMLEFLLDEGLFVLDGLLPGFAQPVAMICVAEKGMATIRLSIDPKADLDPTAHASTPPAESAIGIVARAASRLERSPFPTHSDSMCLLLGALRGGFGWPLQPLMSNLWLFAPLLKLVFAAKPRTATLVRTTTALTVFRAGAKSNVLPQTAAAIVNHRLHPRDSVASVKARDVRVINDPRVRVEVIHATEPSPVSSVDHPAFASLRHAVHEVFPGAAVAPGLFIAASDSKHFWGLAAQIYRFSPIALHVDQTKMFHGHSERIGVEAHAKNVAFMRTLHVRSQARSGAAVQ